MHYKLTDLQVVSIRKSYLLHWHFNEKIQFFGILHHIEKYIYGWESNSNMSSLAIILCLTCMYINSSQPGNYNKLFIISSDYYMHNILQFYSSDETVVSIVILNSSSCAIFVWVLLRLVRWFLYAILVVVVDILQNIQVHCPNVLESEQLFYVYVVKFIDFAWLNSIYLVSESSE